MLPLNHQQLSTGVVHHNSASVPIQQQEQQQQQQRPLEPTTKLQLIKVI
jgi:hypothetical protein